MLVKPPLVTFIPGSPGQAYKAASTVCTSNPPPPDTGPTTPPPPPSGGGSGDAGVMYYVYVPVNPANPAMGETRTPFGNHPGAGYVCDVTPQVYYVEDPNFPNGMTPVYERRCNWTYP